MIELSWETIENKEEVKMSHYTFSSCKSRC